VAKDSETLKEMFAEFETAQRKKMNGNSLFGNIDDLLKKVVTVNSKGIMKVLQNAIKKNKAVAKERVKEKGEWMDKMQKMISSSYKIGCASSANFDIKNTRKLPHFGNNR
jgi:hypothetical protein